MKAIEQKIAVHIGFSPDWRSVAVLSDFIARGIA